MINRHFLVSLLDSIYSSMIPYLTQIPYHNDIYIYICILTLQTDCRFNREGPNVVHMTIKPQEIVDEEDAKAAKSTQSRDHEEGERSPGCRCVIL